MHQLRFQNPEGSNFCARCGSALTKVDEAAPAAARAAEEPTESGTVLNPPSAGETTSSIPVVAEEPLASFGALSNDEEAAIESLPAGSGLLIVHRGPAAGGARYLLDSDLHTAGRSPDSDIFLDDITVSRHHVEFSRTDRGIAVRDVGSLNGTYVNRTLIDGDVVLKPGGDEVQIGKFRMVYFAQRPGD